MPPAVAAAVIGGGVSLFGLSQQQRAAKRAGKRQEAVAREGLTEEQRRFDLEFEAGAPFRAAGEEALARIRAGDIDIEGSPIFQQRLETETGALRGQLAASGQLRGGRGLRAVSELTRGLTAEETQRQFGDLFRTAQLGLQAGFPGGGVDVSGVTSAIGAGGAAGQIIPKGIVDFGTELPALLSLLRKQPKREGLFAPSGQGLN